MQKTTIYISILTVIFLCIIGYLILSKNQDEILPAEARNNVKQGKYNYIVDVRTKREWDEGHLPNTISIPIGELVSELPNKIPNKDAIILFICKKGIRASGVVIMAHKLGYNNVQAMIGNFKDLEAT